MTPAEAAAPGRRTMVVAVANSGGTLAEGWVPTIVEALEAGLDVASGLHERLAEFPAVARGRGPVRQAAAPTCATRPGASGPGPARAGRAGGC